MFYIHQLLTSCQLCFKGLTRHKVIVSTTHFAFTTAPCGVCNTDADVHLTPNNTKPKTHKLIHNTFRKIFVDVSYGGQLQQIVQVDNKAASVEVLPVHSWLDQLVQLAAFYWLADGTEPSPHR